MDVVCVPTDGLGSRVEEGWRGGRGSCACVGIKCVFQRLGLVEMDIRLLLGY